MSLLVTWVAVWPLRSAALVVFAFLYFIWLLGYAAWAFRQGARAAGGVTHWRMQHAALGALLLAVVFILAVLMAVWPVSRAVAASLVPLAALGAALNYYFAFAPPAWLRRMWQSSELYGLLSDRAARGRRGVAERRAEPAVHVRRFGSRRDRRLRGVMGRQRGRR